MIYINNIFPLKGERWFPRLYGMCLPPTTVHIFHSAWLLRLGILSHTLGKELTG